MTLPALPANPMTPRAAAASSCFGLQRLQCLETRSSHILDDFLVVVDIYPEVMESLTMGVQKILKDGLSL